MRAGSYLPRRSFLGRYHGIRTIRVYQYWMAERIVSWEEGKRTILKTMHKKFCGSSQFQGVRKTMNASAIALPEALGGTHARGLRQIRREYDGNSPPWFLKRFSYENAHDASGDRHTEWKFSGHFHINHGDHVTSTKIR